MPNTERPIPNSTPELSEFSSTEENFTSERGNFRTLSAPITLQWELTPFFFYLCVHCYNFWREDLTNNKLVINPETLAVFDRASSEIVNNKVFHVTVTGGEPLAVLKQSSPYLERLAENDVGISFNTNLTMFNKEKAQLLKNLGVRSILTSLMSGNPCLNDNLANRLNTHRDVTRGIRLALSEGFWVAVNMVVTKKNLHDIYATAEYVKSLGVTAFSATKASTPINSPDFSEYALSQEEFHIMIGELLRVRDELDLHTDSLEFYPMCFFDTQEARDFAGNRICNAGKTACTVGFDGMVRPCSHAVQTYGSILDEELNDPWIKMQPWRTDECIPRQCSECSSRNWCRGGCRTEAYASCGRLDSPDPYCDFSHPVLVQSRANTSVKVDFGTSYFFHPAIKSRVENFGGILFVTPVRWAGVTEKMYNFFRENRSKEFPLGILANALGLSESDKIKRTAQILIQKTILLKGGEVNGS